LYQIMTIRIPAAEARRHFAEIVKKAKAGERIKLTRYDKTLAVIIPKNDLDVLEDCEGTENDDRVSPPLRTPSTAKRVVKKG
jgi:prevent-host-death family protein